MSFFPLGRMSLLCLSLSRSSSLPKSARKPKMRLSSMEDWMEAKSAPKLGSSDSFVLKDVCGRESLYEGRACT